MSQPVSNVTSLNDPSNTPIDRTIDWIAEKTTRGYLNANSGRFYQTALKQLASVLGADEPRDILSVLKDIEQIAARWSHMNPGNDGDTARNYLQKSRRALEWHRDFLLDPVNFRFDISSRKASQVAAGEERTPKAKSQAKPKPQPTAEEPAATAAPTPQAPQAAQPAYDHRYKLGHGREIAFTLPDDFKMQEAFRFALHIVTHAVDFNPLDPEHVALVRSALVHG